MQCDSNGSYALKRRCECGRFRENAISNRGISDNQIVVSDYYRDSCCCEMTQPTIDENSYKVYGYTRRIVLYWRCA